MGLVCLEPVIVGIQLDEVTVGQDGQGRDNVEDDLADRLLDQEAVSNIGGVGEVELQSRWVDEGDLCCSDLMLELVWFIVHWIGALPEE